MITTTVTLEDDQLIGFMSIRLSVVDSNQRSRMRAVPSAAAATGAAVMREIFRVFAST
jgi:hypothetical protein